ncbi:MAG TPA: condensation domain-containing protein, partial [Candidatus Deferrimicrobium sp.]|nr:condensation domain-containing protein [Candidatus Deferrimicrobium sp.]
MQNIEDILALTSMQEGMLFHYLKDPEGSHYVEQLSLHISGHIELHYFEQAWNVVIAANEMLRTVFRWEKLEKPSQIILKEHQGELSFHDLSNMDNCRMKTALEEIRSKDRDEGFDLTRVPFRIILCKLDEMQYEMVISNHHILYDGWSNGIILKEFFKAYHGIATGGYPLKFPVKPLFKEFIKWIQNCDRNKQAKYWREY